MTIPTFEAIMKNSEKKTKAIDLILEELLKVPGMAAKESTLYLALDLAYQAGKAESKEA